MIMSGIRKLSYCLLALLPIFSAPSFAGPTKLYDLKACVGAFADENGPLSTDHKSCATTQSQGLDQQTGPTLIVVRVFNASPPTSNSQISSIDLVVDVDWRVQGPASTVLVAPKANNTFVDISIDNHLKVGNIPPIKPEGWVTLKFNVDNFSCGDGRWNVTAYTGSSFTGATFQKVSDFTSPLTSVACAQLGCDKSVTAIQPQGSEDITALGYISKLTRGINQDGTSGTACESLYAYMTPSTNSSGVTSLNTVWDKNRADTDVAVFSYEVNIVRNAASTVANTLSNLKVAWLPKTDGTPDYQPVTQNGGALLCNDASAAGGGLQNKLPFAYTTLVSDDGSKITVASSLGVPAVPFSIVIEQERMLVTKVNTNTNVWTVTRPTGGTSTPTTVPTHPVDSPVMSTPFRIGQPGDGFSASYVGLIAPICINSITPVAGDLTGTKFKAVVIDGSDGYVRLGGF